MSQNSMLNIQQISSRTFNNDPSIMETSIEHFQRQNHINFTKSDFNNMSLKKTVNISFDDILKELKQENEAYRKELQAYKNRLMEIQKGNGINPNQQNYIKGLIQELNNKQEVIREIKQKYLNSIANLKQTIEKNEILGKQVERLSKKLKDSELIDSNKFIKLHRIILIIYHKQKVIMKLKL